MKVHILIDHLQKKLPFVNHAVSSRSQLPVLLNFLLETKDGKLRVAATDLEIGIEILLPATVEEEGGITVPAKLFLELISSLPSGKATLQIKDTSLEISTSKTKSLLQTIAKDEFPSLYEDKGSEVAVLTKDVLDKNFSHVVFAASPDVSRPALSGVLFHQEEQGFLLVATDGYRLSLEHVPVKTVAEEQSKFLVPSRVIKEVLQLKDTQEVTIYISGKSNQVIFSQGETTVVGRLIEAEFPNYERIIPTHHDYTALFTREELLKAVKTCAIFARETSNIVKLALKPRTIVVSANTPSIGENRVEVEAEVTGDENEIAFNARYLMDVLSTLEEETLLFEMTGPLNPGVFKIKDNGAFLHLIMPIRVQN